ncbi:MAG: outer membrane beta-barrel protein [Pseudomonadota bacterium]
MYRKVFVPIAALLLSLPAFADDNSGIYLFGALGQTQTSTSQPESNLFFAGYQFNNNWGIEAGNVNLGQLPALATASATSIFAVKYWNVSEFGKASRFSFLTKIGAAKVTTKLTPTFSKSGVAYGVGGAYKIDEEWDMRIEATSLKTGNANENRIAVLSLGLSYLF